VPDADLLGEEDKLTPRSVAHQLYDNVGSKDKTLKVFTVAEGGAEHCQVDNRRWARITSATGCQQGCIHSLHAHAIGCTCYCRCGRGGAGLSAAADPHGDSVSRRRLDRRHRPLDRAELERHAGQQIVIDNRGGAGGTLGTDLVAKAQPDGYTILYGNSGPLSIGPLLYKKLGYDLFRDLAPVSQSVSSPFVVFATQSLPPNNAAELIAYAKERPNQINYASSGVGSGLHLVGELFQSVTGTKLVHVPFKGISQALAELFTGRVQLAMSTTAGLAPHVRAGRMKASSAPAANVRRNLPEVPTCIEAALPGFCVSSWHAIVAPAGTPRR
jgi:hypothetical protein